MSVKKKMVIGSGVVVLLLVIGGFALVSADGPWRFACSPFHGRLAGAGHPGLHSAEMAEFFLWRLDQQADALNLTPEQEAKYNLWKDDINSHFSQGQTARRQWLVNLRTELNKEQPDVPMLIESVKTKLNEMSAFADQNLDLFTDLWRSLDAAQQQVILDHVRERAQHHTI